MSEIAIITTSIDAPTFESAVQELEERGYPTFVFMSDKVFSGEHELLVEIRQNNFHITYNGVERAFEAFGAAWFRHPDLIGANYTDKAKQLSIEHETKSLQESLWQQVPDNAWLNHPETMNKAQAKLSQLAIASELGFMIPKTCVANRWQPIDELMEDSEVIVKMPKGVTYDGTRTKVLYATKLDREKRVALEDANPYPAIYQEYKSKAREWRVTVVGDNVFSAAIYTEEGAKDDWRKHQLSTAVSFKAESMAEDEVVRCIEYLGRFGLRYGAFDFIESNDGHITFLECNTNGQYRWLEDMLGFQITNAIADELVAIYDENTA